MGCGSLPNTFSAGAPVTWETDFCHSVAFPSLPLLWVTPPAASSVRRRHVALVTWCLLSREVSTAKMSFLFMHLSLLQIELVPLRIEFASNDSAAGAAEQGVYWCTLPASNQASY